MAADKLKLTSEQRELINDYVTKVDAEATSFALAMSSQSRSQSKMEPTNDQGMEVFSDTVLFIDLLIQCK